MAHPRTERLTRYWKQLPPGQRGSAILVLWVNALVTITLQGSLLVAVTRLWRHRGDGGPGSARGLAVLGATVVAHQVVRSAGMRALDRISTNSRSGAGRSSRRWTLGCGQQRSGLANPLSQRSQS